MTTYSSMHRWLYFSARQSNLTGYLLATGSGCIHTVNSILWRCLIVLKLEWLGYHMVKKLWRYVKPFSSDTGTQRTDLLYKYHASVCWRAIKSNGTMGQMTGQFMYVTWPFAYPSLRLRWDKRAMKNQTPSNQIKHNYFQIIIFTSYMRWKDRMCTATILWRTIRTCVGASRGLELAILCLVVQCSTTGLS